MRRQHPWTNIGWLHLVAGMGFAILLMSLAFSVSPCLADEPAKPSAKASAEYLAGLDALSAGKWADAAAAFTKAADADEDNAEYLTARGVARALAQQPADAIKDLQRSMRMRDDWETKLWLGAAFNMNGDAASGANFIVHGPPGSNGVPKDTKADHDYSLYVYTMSHNYWAARTHGKYTDSKTNKTMTTEDIASADFPKAGGLFAARRQAAAPPQLAGDLLDRAKANIANQKCAAALKDLNSLLAASPEDDGLLLLHATCLLALGDYAGSRSEYTRVLADQPTLAAGYVGRSMAAAHLADGARANSDLTIAEKLGGENLKSARQQVDAALAGDKPADPADALAQLDKSVRAGEGEGRLVELALAVNQAVNGRRLRYDEIYQDRLRVLDEALRAAPKNPDRLADLADFLFAESNPPFEQVEPRSWPIYYRYVPQGTPKLGPMGEILPTPPVQRTAREVARASGLADEALKANPEHVRSLGIKGTILNSQGEYGQAKDVLDKAVGLKPDDYKLLRERSVAEQGIAREDELAANALEMPKINTVNNGNGTSTTTTTYPSQADLARAAELHREAKIAHQQAVDDMAKVMKLTDGTAMGSYYQGLTDYAYHNVAQAKADFQQAVKLDPKLRDAWEQLARMNLELNLPEEWAAAREGMLGPIQTTAAPWLTVARERIGKTQFKGSREAVAEATKIDASDPRAQVYAGVIDAANDKSDEAMARYHIALALEEARNQLHGRSFAAPQADSLPLTPEDIGLTLALRNNVGALLLAQGQAERAGKLFQANVDFLSTLPPENLATPVPQAMLPSTTANVTMVPQPITYAILKIRAQGGLDCVNWTRKYNDPKDVALAAATYKRLIADANIDTSNPVVMQAVISLALAELEVSKGNSAHALELLKNEGATPQSLWQEMRRTEDAARKGTSAVELDTYQKEQDRQTHLSPQDAQRERLLADRKSFVRDRQRTTDDLNKPDLTNQEKLFMQNSVADYDKRIADIDAKLRQLDAGASQPPATQGDVRGFRPEQPSPADFQRQQYEAQKKQFQAIRKNLLDRMNQPDLSDQQRQSMQGTVAQYDRIIADIDKKISQLGGGGK